jgi:general stress protein 26
MCITSMRLTMALKDEILKVIEGMHPAAIATIDNGQPAVRFMVLTGFPDMTLVGGTMKASRKVEQLRKNPNASISIWSGKEFTDPYVVIKAKGKVHEDLATKEKYWNPMFEQYFRTVGNPDYVILVFTATEIEYTDPTTMGMETWRR